MSRVRALLTLPMAAGIWAKRLLQCGLLWACCWPVHATFFFIPFSSPRVILLQVGAAGATINEVRFNVSNALTSPAPTSVAGVPDGATPATTPSGGVVVRLRGQWPSGSRNVFLTVASPASLTCATPASCGSTAIPIGSISWVANDKTNFTTFDIQNGSFTGAAAQPLTGYNCCGGSDAVEMTNTLNFSYNNTTLFPAGSYTARVTYTASLQ